MTNTTLWQAKLLARIHDPAEKSIILMNTLEGHEGGTVAALKKQLFTPEQLTELNQLIKTADHWAAAADRPNLPKGHQWDINFLSDFQLVHPLSGARFHIKDMNRQNTDLKQLKADSLKHFTRLIQKDASGNIDHQKSYFANWRFGAEGKMVEGGWGGLWEQLPADTRIPDHTIWAHLDLTSAFTGSMRDADGQPDTPVLLSMQFGPVQDFIAQARSTSDLWAGSHLLSRLTWQGIKTLCNELGPDSVLIPQLRGVAVVDAWLHQEQGLPLQLFKDAGAAWTKANDDSNPLFAAALPNKFTALVPKSRVKELAQKVEQSVRDWVQTLGRDMLKELLKKAGEDENNRSLPCWTQLEAQLAGFPECYWAAVPFDLIADVQGRATPEQRRLAEVQGSFIPKGESFLDSKIWKDILSKDLQTDGHVFWQPNAGVLFPAIYELLERLAASSKQARTFEQLKQEGFRCTLTGETEWLTTDRAQLGWTNRQREANAKHDQANQKTLWMRVAGKYGIKKGEHLGALGMIKRLWPSFFACEVAKVLGKPDWQKAQRYVISTHAMSLAPALARLADPDVDIRLLEQRIEREEFDSVILPTKLIKQLRKQSPALLELAKQLPSMMDDDREVGQTEQFLADMKSVLGVRPESYYAIFFMDGDNMGAWLTGGNAGEEAKYDMPYKNSFHPALQSKMNGVKDTVFKQYLDSYRAVSPARHLAVSGALNSFALHLARYIVEECYMGKLFYAGGDDVMAMVTVKDLLPCIYALRMAYSGVAPAKSTDFGKQLVDLNQLHLGGGHAFLNGHLYRTMGHKASASVGAVIAHSTAPLQHVLTEVRAMESRAKASTNKDGESRDAFAIKVIKRAGGAVSMNGKWLLDDQVWGSTLDFDVHLKDETLQGDLSQPQSKLFQIESTRMGLLMQLSRLFSVEGELSRKLAYVVQDWLPQLPQLNSDSKQEDCIRFAEQVRSMLVYQIGRQKLKPKDNNPLTQPTEIAKKLLLVVGIRFDEQDQVTAAPREFAERLNDVLAVIEFIGRQERQVTPQAKLNTHQEIGA